VAKAVNAAAFFDNVGWFGASLESLCRGDGEVGLGVALTREEPVRWTLRTPVATQPLKQCRGDEDMAVLRALALFDAQ
jgi:hypothetical protein